MARQTEEEIDDLIDLDWTDDRAIRRHNRSLRRVPQQTTENAHDVNTLDWDSDLAVRLHMRNKYWSFDAETGCWQSPISPAVPPSGETFEVVLRRYEEHRKQFLASPSWAGLKHVVSRRVSRGQAVKNAVCIALGSLSAFGAMYWDA